MSHRLSASAAFFACFALAGCVGSGESVVDPAADPALEQALAELPAEPSGVIAGLAQPDAPNCPTVEISPGGAALRGRGSAGGASGVDYQASINDIARECRFDGTTMTIRVGVRGRVVLGSAGRAGSYSVPIHITVRSLDQVFYNNVARLSVSTTGATGGTPFQHVEENIRVPQAPDATDIYEIFVSLDANAKAAPKKQRRG
jgi:hypothetical protein